MEIVKLALEKSRMIRFSYERKEPFRVILSIRNETFELVCNPDPWTRNNVECIISFSEIKEIRPGKNSKDFSTSLVGKRCDSSRCFVIYYGTKFCLKTLSIYVEPDKRNSSFVEKSDLIQTLLNGLNILKEIHFSCNLKVDIWTKKTFQAIKFGDSVGLSQMINSFSSKINLKKSTVELIKLSEKYRSGVGLGVKPEEFTRLLRECLHDQQIFTDCFGKYSLTNYQVSRDQFEKFLEEEQKQGDSLNPSIEYLTVESDGNAYLTNYKVIDYLYSKTNEVCYTKLDRVNQDMTRPLSHYWIASSHNTYLTGNQWHSESSVEAYVRALLQGCRCIEMDCFNGKYGPIIYHGRTLTTKISFVDVLMAIRDYAFVTSEYPLIISIENHCSIKQQKIMAKKFVEIFGPMLVTSPIQTGEIELPSPEALKRRIIIKSRKLDDSGEGRRPSDSNKDSISGSKKTGVMHLQSQAGKWEPYFFALIDDKLHFSAMEDPLTPGPDSRQFSLTGSNDDLHFKEVWFHGEIRGGHQEAEKRMKNFNKEGCFLVRNSSTKGEYTLCLLYKGEVHKIKIERTEVDSSGQRMFFLDPKRTFENLYLLITYYCNHPLNSETVVLERFGDPVPPPEKHENELWFHRKLSREGAEDIISRVAVTGAFVGRYASEGAGARFAISFRLDRLVKHCLIKEDGRLLMVGNRAFENISDLVAFYHDKPFYKWVRLVTPVTQEIIALHNNSKSKPTQMMTHTGYLVTAEIQAFAIRDYFPETPANPNIYFQKGDTIHNVEKINDEIWSGTLGDGRKIEFPKEFVEITEAPDSPFGTQQHGVVEKPKVEILPNPRPNTPYPFIVKISSNISSSRPPFNAAVSSESEAKTWEAAINELSTNIVGRSCRTSLGNIRKIFSKRMSEEKNTRIAKEFSELIVYGSTVSKPVPTQNRQNGRVYNQISSFNEAAGEKLAYSDPSFTVWFSQVQLLRTFPKAQRIDSSNYNPVVLWNVGVQNVSLNYQTPEKYMQIYRGKFKQNGSCGYVLKPDFLRSAEEFNPNDMKCLEKFGIKPMKLELRVLAGRHVFRDNEKGVVSPFVEVEIMGASFDRRKVVTQTIDDNGLNPFWNKKFELEIKNPALALIQFSVLSKDMFGDTHFIGENTYPVEYLLPGYRSVPLLNGYGEEILSTLLIHLTLE